jgi:hypothetical protein
MVVEYYGEGRQEEAEEQSVKTPKMRAVKEGDEMLLVWGKL